MSDVETEMPSGPPTGDVPSETPSDDDPGRGRVIAIGAVGAAVVVAVVAFLVFGGDDDDASDSATPTSTPVPADLGPTLDAEGTELDDLLAAAQELEYHATYRTVGGDQDVTLDLWRKGGVVRQDSRIETDAGTADTSSFLLDDGRSVTCTRRDDDPWTCSEALSETSPDGIFGSVLDQLGGQDVEVVEETIDGRDARCFRFGATDGAGEMCVTEEGIPARALVGETGLELESLERDVDDDVFEPPAEVTSAG